MNLRCFILAACLSPLTASLPLFSAEPMLPELAAIRNIGPKGAGYAEAATAAKSLQSADPQHLLDVLAALDGANPLAQNWLRGIASAMAERQLQAKGKLPVEQLEVFLQDTQRSPRGRRLAYELIARVDDGAEKKYIPGLLNDPSLELRHDAVAYAMQQADDLAKTDKEAAKTKYQVAFESARDQFQVQAAADKLKELGVSVDLATHYGYLMQWQLIAPFDNVDDKGWDVAYPPEKELDFAKKYAGKDGEIAWGGHTTTDPLGLVDLNAVLEKYKGAICYATTTFVSDKDQTVDLRVNSVSAVKAWVNGKEVLANHAYHSTTGNDIDQYVRSVDLKQGKNVILLKICQNEQTEGWAQRWQFSVRVCDEVGTPIFSQDRKLPKTAAK